MKRYSNEEIKNISNKDLILDILQDMVDEERDPAVRERFRSAMEEIKNPGEIRVFLWDGVVDCVKVAKGLNGSKTIGSGANVIVINDDSDCVEKEEYELLVNDPRYESIDFTVDHASPLQD